MVQGTLSPALRGAQDPAGVFTVSLSRLHLPLRRENRGPPLSGLGVKHAEPLKDQGWPV